MEIQFVDITSYRGISSDAEHFYARVGAPKDVQEFYITCMDCDVNAGVYFHDERQLRYFPTEEEARSLWQKDHGFDKREITLKYKEDDIADLFLELATNEAQLKYPTYYAIARDGKAGKTPELDNDLHVIFDAIINEIPEPQVDPDDSKGAQLLVAALAADSYLGKYSIGKIFRGKLKKNEAVTIMKTNGEKIRGKIDSLYTYRGLGREETTEAIAGDIVALAGLGAASIGDTIATGDNPEALPTIELEAPTLSIYIGPNTSPLKGREGEFTTSRQIGDRLQKELETNIALRLEPQGLGYKVSGRGELHLSVLIETMRREGYELEVGRPEVVYKVENGVEMEPVEELTIEVSPEYVGAVSQELGVRKAELVSQEMTTSGSTRFVYTITTAALIGLRNNLLTGTKGTAIMNTLPKGYQPVTSHYQQERNGALVASEAGQSTA